MPESEKPKQNASAAQTAPTPFQKFQALASALVKVSPSELEKKLKQDKTAQKNRPHKQ
jgi:hypothetical protein